MPGEKRRTSATTASKVRRKAANIFGEVFRNIVARGENRTRAQRFILQPLISVVAEDLGLFPGQMVTSLLAE